MWKDIMKNNFTQNTSLWIVVIFLFFLTGCTIHSTKEISDRLTPGDLYKTFNTKPTNLSVNSKCSTPSTIKIVNIENRTEDFETLQNPPVYGAINPKEMMDSITLYLINGFEQSGIKSDDQSKKVIHIKMQDLKSTAGFWSFGSYCKLQLIIPETRFSKFYEANDNSGHGYAAAVYAIHRVTRQLIDDPDIQNYILCKNDNKEFVKDQEKEKAESISLTQKLQELQTAFEKGLISKEELQQKRNAILEKY
jgi:hypothetical protein